MPQQSMLPRGGPLHAPIIGYLDQLHYTVLYVSCLNGKGRDADVFGACHKSKHPSCPGSATHSMHSTP